MSKTIKTEVVQARINPELKQDTDKIFERLGISRTDAIKMFLTQVKLHNGLPFEVKIPNAELQEAMHQARNRKELNKVGSKEELFDSLGF